MTVNSGDKQVLVNLDCSIQHFLNFVESKTDSLGRASQNEDGATSPGDHLGEDVDALSPARETTKTVVRGGGGKKKLINLDDCYVCFDVLDADGNLMDLSLHNSRSRALDVLSRRSNL